MLIFTRADRSFLSTDTKGKGVASDEINGLAEPHMKKQNSGINESSGE